jgi:hypothetical protein
MTATRLNEQINNALMRLYKRAENLEGALLDDTFVPIPQIDTLLSMPEHHVLYGRRGTGKTHTLRRLERQRKLVGGAALYLDLRTVGSESGLYNDQEISLQSRATTLLVDVVNAIHDGILELVLTEDRFTEDLHNFSQALDALRNAATQVKIQRSVEKEATQTAGGQTRRKSEERYHVVFGTLASAFREVAKALGDQSLWLMLDEWSSLPIELQPYLADMLRRSVFSLRIPVKIGAIERRSRFSEPRPNGDYVGIELGSEATTIDIDEYMAFSKGATYARAFFGQLLFRHTTGLLTDYEGKPLYNSAEDLIGMAFTGDAFIRFVEGSEGLPRDALEIVQKCASQAVDRQITISYVNSACTSYFLQSKEGKLSPTAHSALREMISRCVEMESRMIALRRPIQSRKEVIAELYDQRLIHRRDQGVSLPDKPAGDTYDMFLVDLGCFTELISRRKLRLVDHGLRDRGIVRTDPDASGRRSGPQRKAAYVLMPEADRWP